MRAILSTVISRLRSRSASKRTISDRLSLCISPKPIVIWRMGKNLRGRGRRKRSLDDRRQRPAKSLDFLFAVVVVHRGAHEAVQATLLHINASRALYGYRDVDVMRCQFLLDLFGFLAIDAERDNPALGDSAITHDDARKCAESSPQMVGQGFYASPEGVHAPLQGIIDGDTQANLASVVRLPVLEAARIWQNLVAVSCYPLCCMQVQERRLQAFQDIVADVEETGDRKSTRLNS